MKFMLSDCLRESIRNTGFNIVAELSAPGPKGPTYVLTHESKFEVRVQEENLPAFIQGFGWGRYEERKRTGGGRGK